MPTTTKKAKIQGLVLGSDEAIKGHDRSHPKRKAIKKPWHLECKVSDYAQEFWKRVFECYKGDWWVHARYRNEREANINLDKQTKTFGKRDTLDYRVVYKP